MGRCIGRGRYGGCYQSVASASSAAAAISALAPEAEAEAASPLPGDASAAGPGRERSGRGSSRSGIAATGARGSSCLGAGGQEQSLGRGGTTLAQGNGRPGVAPREGRYPWKGKRCSSVASSPRQLSGPVPNDGELPRPGNDRRRVLWARVQGAPEAQRPGEGRGLGLCSVWPGLISGASCVLRLCQDFGTRHSFGFPLAILTRSGQH